ncbi:hypothetical protein IAG41_11235 [Sphingomonas sp. JC676]|uniref:hypothetical protein n=1 Tax=Sphingomonas sp. JC676 TaxID=2768065 RepID=UPI00165779F2|nr:hypothetical protein [Sphingomonas sp. JC676]MBC9032968.1 hypothetical protein [Sphingomonas sp. JC676]
MLILFLAIVMVLELARRMPLVAAFRDMAACQAHAVRLMQRRGVSEWGKERAMRILAGRLFARSLRAGGLLVVVASPLLLVLGLAAVDPRLIGAHLDWVTRLWVAPMSLGYAALRWQVGPRVRAR